MGGGRERRTGGKDDGARVVRERGWRNRLDELAATVTILIRA